jgi:[acyl-carrier-protein] S-malonyltransferase
VSGVAAWVAGRPITVATVEERLAELRRGPYAARLPHPATAEGRNLRRWLVQVLTVEAVVEHEATALGLSPADAPSGSSRPLTLAEALRTGGVTAAVVAAHPLARALRARVAPAVPAPQDETQSYFHRNRDQHPQDYAEVRDDLAARLGADNAERRFARWLEERCATLVRLEPGYEHPGDPRHPDAVHRH